MSLGPGEAWEQGDWSIRFVQGVSTQEKTGITQALQGALTPANRILEAHSRVKRFYKVPSKEACFFIKLRQFHSWPRRLGRSFRPTKEERELANYQLLKSMGIPCPRPLASARLKKGSLTRASVLVTIFLEETKPLKERLLGPEGRFLLEPLAGFLGLLKNAGIVHRDLHWGNILSGSSGQGFTLYLVDPLHVRLMDGPQDRDFAMSMAWFLGFMIREGAKKELVGLVARNMVSLGLCGPWGEQELLLKARQMGAP